MEARREEIPNTKCIICGYKKMAAELRDERPLCYFCGSPQFFNVLVETVNEIRDQIRINERVDCEGNPLFSFVADLGALGSEHLFLTSLRRVLSEMMRLVRASGGVAEVDRLWGVVGARHVARFLALIYELGLIELQRNEEGFWESLKTPPGGVIRKVTATIESEPQLNRAANFMLGYITLEVIRQTLELIEQNGTLMLGEGITKMYPVDRRGRVMVTKGYTAPIAWVFGSWANGRNEFSELDLHRFLNLRGLGGKAFRRILMAFASSYAGMVHALYKFKVTTINGAPMHWFSIDEDRQRLRERIMERIRERERGE